MVASDDEQVEEEVGCAEVARADQLVAAHAQAHSDSQVACWREAWARAEQGEVSLHTAEQQEQLADEQAHAAEQGIVQLMQGLSLHDDVAEAVAVAAVVSRKRPRSQWRPDGSRRRQERKPLAQRARTPADTERLQRKRCADFIWNEDDTAALRAALLEVRCAGEVSNFGAWRQVFRQPKRQCSERRGWVRALQVRLPGRAAQDIDTVLTSWALPTAAGGAGGAGVHEESGNDDVAATRRRHLVIAAATYAVV